MSRPSSTTRSRRSPGSRPRLRDDASAIAAGIASHFGVPEDVALETPAVLVRTEESIVEQIQARRERWQMSSVVVDEQFVDAMAPVVARLAAT